MKGARLREGGNVRSWPAGGARGAGGQDENCCCGLDCWAGARNIRLKWCKQAGKRRGAGVAQRCYKCRARGRQGVAGGEGGAAAAPAAAIAGRAGAWRAGGKGWGSGDVYGTGRGRPPWWRAAKRGTLRKKVEMLVNNSHREAVYESLPGAPHRTPPPPARAVGWQRCSAARRSKELAAEVPARQVRAAATAEKQAEAGGASGRANKQTNTGLEDR